MINIRVRIFSQAMPDCSDIVMEEGASVESLLARLKEDTISEEPKRDATRVAFLSNQGSLIVLLNGMSIYSLSGWKTTLRDGDEVSLLPMVAGG
jgi:molybdopterin converting factor small subunit